MQNGKPPHMCQMQTPLFSSINSQHYNFHHLQLTHNLATDQNFLSILISAMAKIFLSVLGFLLLFSFSFAIKEGSWQQGQCAITRINAQEPSYRLESEGGESEFWDHNNDEFQCAGVSFHRHRLRARGLMLPAYHNAPILVYVLQGLISSFLQ